MLSLVTVYPCKSNIIFCPSYVLNSSSVFFNNIIVVAVSPASSLQSYIASCIDGYFVSPIWATGSTSSLSCHTAYNVTFASSVYWLPLTYSATIAVLSFDQPLKLYPFLSGISPVIVNGIPSIFICFVGPPYPLFALYVTSYLALFSSINSEPAYLCPVSSYVISAYSSPLFFSTTISVSPNSSFAFISTFMLFSYSFNFSHTLSAVISVPFNVYSISKS